MTTILDTRSLFPLLAGHQERVLGILEGLDEERLRRPVLPSGWSCLGMVQHLRLMTRFWFADVMTGRLSAYPDDEFAVDHDQPGSDALDAYAEQTAAARASVQDLPLDTAPAWWPEGQWGDWRLAAGQPVRGRAARPGRDRLPRRPPGRRPRAARRPYLGLRCGPAGRAWVTSPTDLSDPGLWCAATWSGVRPGDQLVVDGLVRGAASRWTGRWSPGDGRCCCCGSSPRPPPTASA